MLLVAGMYIWNGYTLLFFFNGNFSVIAKLGVLYADDYKY
jgi:hypothetical protein